jgi:hypothetical protein
LVEQANADLKKVNDKQESALTLARGTADSDMIEYIKGAWIKLSATSEIRVKKNKEELVKIGKKEVDSVFTLAKKNENLNDYIL